MHATLALKGLSYEIVFGKKNLDCLDEQFALPLLFMFFVFSNIYFTKQKMKSEAANTGVLQIMCFTASRKLKLDMMPGN